MAVRNGYQTVVRQYKDKSGKIIKKTYIYHYDNGVAENIGGNAYTKAHNEIKLTTKKGKLTKAGERFLSEYAKKATSDEVIAMRDELIKYGETRSALLKSSTTMATFTSHLKESKIERMIYNFSMEPEDIADITGESLQDITNEANWDFNNNTFMGKWKFTYDYYEYNGFKLERI